MSARRNAAGAIEFRSGPALKMGALMSVVLVLFSAGLWIALGPELRSLFTWPQTGTLLFFLLTGIGLIMAVGLSTVVVTDEGLVVRNAFVTHRFGWDEVRGAQLGHGDPWAYIKLAPTQDHPEGRNHMALAIQRSEGAGADESIAELQQLISERRR